MIGGGSKVMDGSDGNRIYLADASPDGTSLWSEVDSALDQGCQVWLRSPLLEALTEVLGKESDGCSWLVINARKERGPSSLARLRDIVLSSVSLLLLSPLLLLIAVLVRASSCGSVFFSTTVVGKERNPFTWRKFRSMRVVPEADDVERRRARFQSYVEGNNPSDAADVPKKVIETSRVTPVGRFIRKFSIDELPQLWNVLRGEMSLVGPRPCLPYEADFYTGWRDQRFSVKPGLTGVWQVFGRGRVGFDESAAMDVFYVYRRSLGFDLYLIYKTIGVVLSGRGAL